MTAGTPPPEVQIDTTLVRRLIAEQHPDLEECSIKLLDIGWDNEMYRVGDKWVARIPRRGSAVSLLLKEQVWLPRLANRLPVSIPVAQRIGRPSTALRYPWPWSIVPWLPGEAADLAPPHAHQARPLAEFLKALHIPAPADAPVNEFRGVPLIDRADSVRQRLERLRDCTDAVTPLHRQLWHAALLAPTCDQPRLIHGDLHSRNVIVHEGIIRGIIDWGDLTSGDAATDLASVWMILSSRQDRDECLECYQPSSALAVRAKGWAVFFATVLLETGLVDHPRHAEMGKTILQRLSDDEGY